MEDARVADVMSPLERMACGFALAQGTLHLVSALAAAETEWVLAVAADMPHLEPEIIRALWAARDGGDAVVPLTDKGPEPLLALYRAGKLRLDPLVTRTYALAEINQAFADMRSGANARGVVVF